MTEVITRPPLAALTDEQFAAAWNAADLDDPETFAEYMAEMTRRDRAEREQQRQARRDRAEQALKAEWYDAMHAQRMQAENYCRGWLLSPEAKRLNAIAEQDGKVAVSEWQLWTGPAWMVEKYGSEELKAFFQLRPRLTFAEFRRQRARAGRIQREEWRDREQITERGTEDDHEHEHERAVMAGSAARALRPETPAPQAPQRAGRAVLSGGSPAAADPGAGRDAGDGRPGRLVRGDAVTVMEAPAPFAGEADAGRPADAAGYMAKAAGCRHYRSKYGTPAQCGDCPAARLMPTRAPSEVAVPETAAVTRTAGTAVAVRDPGRIPGDQLLDLIRDKWFGRYARFPSPAALDAVTLWAAHAHMRDAEGVLVFSATPRLYLLSSEPGSGKSHVLELIGMIAPACYGLDLEPTAAGLAHSIAKERATILLDEGDVLFGAGARKSAVRAIINGGYTRHGTVLNGKGAKASRVPVFGALAMAGLDTLEKGANSETLNALMTRGIKIRMVKASGADQPAKLTRNAAAEAKQARTWLEAWAAQVRDEIAGAQPDMPEGIEGRAAQIWEPLIALADAAGGTWPERARTACTELVMAVPLPEPEGDEDLEDQFAAFAASFGEGDDLL